LKNWQRFLQPCWQLFIFKIDARILSVNYHCPDWKSLFGHFQTGHFSHQNGQFLFHFYALRIYQNIDKTNECFSRNNAVK